MQHVQQAQIYNVNLAANESYVLPVGGTYFKILAAQGNVHVEGDGFGTLGVLKAGQGLRNRPFARLVLTDRSGSANDVQILVAGSDFVDDRISGEVSVIDDARSRTLSGDEFTAVQSTPAVAAGETGAVQLWNPAASGVRLVVYGYSVNVTTMMIDSTAAIGAIVGAARNKNRGGLAGASVAEMRRYAAVGTPPGVELWYAGANTLVRFAAPLIVEPNRGICIYNQITGAGFQAAIDFREEVL